MRRDDLILNFQDAVGSRFSPNRLDFATERCNPDGWAAGCAGVATFVVLW